ncbi:Crp/Fnr family transcriptional regulator [Chryseobacterium chendengshani]|uniref:Crp/Fnr family transcriptional regulator n=1 Tax=Chryseobacterium sp. LJ668 TaxID=2864040 RepID=UPI001C69265F|nr:Crp/Fnr family transcriptional regulator [Chryseobacterium sp. LJ668]MBW8523745.1 Crp/Fnr family transcriptional regulator [Chryseobacterium sp. LJ668]QYK16689.1 Crp/Fnr family transcriptional regulator [Chryseobacterium sp. LJ668]
MFLKEELLYSIGASEENYKPGDYLFHEGGNPQFYFQIVSGEVKLNSYHSDGKEFIQSILNSPYAVGEYMLYIEKPYPTNAVALTNCTIIKICRNKLLKFFDCNPGLYINLCRSLSKNLYSKSVMMQKLSCYTAVERLNEVLQMMKQDQLNKSPYTYEIPMTRQQLASLTGLCVETTIRAIKRMEREKILRIKNRKILI